eukprot:TRINITY_DN708_c0_g1_i1.p1 TRINITY_DN708_c0_g1~~TRINITY_DN708_c0_g1_i1.p1  ORF type:complete len:182 (-),score=41.40 TRINITY_DN708_c0_g1_i1:89-583(-)
MADVITQNERAFQKQTAKFSRSRTFSNKGATGFSLAKDSIRYYKPVGLGFKIPKDAIDGTYIDKKCPFTGRVSIRGRILKGVVHSARKMTNTIIIRRDYLHYIRKYNRYEKRHTNLAVHCSPAFTVRLGDIVTVGQCRPVSKTVRFNVLKVQTVGKAGKQFRGA